MNCISIDPDDTKDYQEIKEKLGKSINRLANEFKIKNFEAM
ncbi:hypothetical protein [Peribacillus butanolivorans]|nr:hypothetical protein [Peribacillus butanolivorans]